MIAVILALALAPCLAADEPQPARTATSVVDQFRDALFLSTRDYSADGSHAVDLYWKADGLASAKSLDAEFYSELNSLYGALKGDRVLHATLTDAGWSVDGPKARLILGQGTAFTGLLLLVSNQTARPQSVNASITGANVHASEPSLQLKVGETVAFAPEIQSEVLGALRAELRFSGTHRAVVALVGEVRPAVHLRVRILDAEGSVTPARVYIHAADGLSHTPSGLFDRLMWMTAEHYFYAPGTLDVILPAGATRIEVRKGFDYMPAIRTLDLTSETAPLEVSLCWLDNVNASGWYGGDDHIHGNYTGEQWSTPADDLLAVRAEGLNVGNLLVSNSTGGTIHDERNFAGKRDAISTRDAILFWNQEMRTWSYGHLVLLNVRRLVRPLYTGFPDSSQWEDYPSNYTQAKQARDHGGIALYAHPALRFDDIPAGSLAGESVADVALGAIDAFEVFCSYDEPSMELWYRFLNLGFKLPISGGSDAFLNQHFSFLAGGERVYVNTGGHLNYAAWIDGLRHGRSFATVGPLLMFALNGKPPGAEEQRGPGPERAVVHVNVVSTIPISKVEVVQNGRVVAQASSSAPTERLEWSGTISVDHSSWLAARVWGPDNDRIANGPSRWSQRRSPALVLLAHTSPSYVYIGDEPIFSESDRDFCLRWLDALAQRIRKSGKFATAAHCAEVLATFARARQVYERMRTGIAEPRP